MNVRVLGRGPYERPIGAVCNITFDTFVLRRGWRADGLTFSGDASAVFRRLTPEYDGDPDWITLDEMNSKLYRFVAYGELWASFELVTYRGGGFRAKGLFSGSEER